MIEEHNAWPCRRASAHGLRLRQAMMGDSLRTLFDAVVEEPIPEAFRDLLRQLDERGSEAA